MCGIDVVIALTGNDVSLPSELISPALLQALPVDTNESRRRIVSRRGPDFSDNLVFQESGGSVDIFSSVLQIQGVQLCRQPVVSQVSQSVLCWNGEFLNHAMTDSSDTQLILERLCSGVRPQFALDDVEGPFAFVFYDRGEHSIWFGKDKQGRRSLLFRKSLDHQLIISSSYLSDGIEIPAGVGVYELKLGSSQIILHPWANPASFAQPSFLSLDSSSVPDISQLYSCMRSGIRRHISSICIDAPLGILFSGGVDSMIIATLAGEEVLALSESHRVCPEIHLFNVALAGTDSPDRATGLVSLEQLKLKFGLSKVVFKYYLISMSESEILDSEQHIMDLARPNDSLMDFNIATALWFGGQGKGELLDEDSLFSDPMWAIHRDRIIGSESMEAALANRTSKKGEIFAQGDGLCAGCGKMKPKPGCGVCKFCCRKRGTGCVFHKQNLEEGSENNCAVDDILPLESLVKSYCSVEVHTSMCRLLLVGHGADELFGGYGRHETRGLKGGIECMRREMLLDLGRLWTRNLGRDDRVLADHGRDVRHPFLDEAVVEWVGRQKLWSGGENKPFLRQMCREHLGLANPLVPASFRKRAIQFGTRLAQRTNVLMFGSHSKGKGDMKIVGL